MCALHALWRSSLFLVLLYSFSCCARLVNRTIDDSLGDSETGFRPIFRPVTPGVWEDQTCKSCFIQPDRRKAFDGTWTAATYNSGLKNISVTLEFPGVAIYVFLILANRGVQEGTTTLTECNFTLDGIHAGAFSHQPDLTTVNMEYNATAFAATGLSNDTHQLIISTNDVDHDVYVNFDYAIYTFSQPDVVSKTSSSTRSTASHTATSSNGNSKRGGLSVGAIVGIALGVLAFILASIIIILVCVVHNKRQTRKGSPQILNIDGRALEPSGNAHLSPSDSVQNSQPTFIQYTPNTPSFYADPVSSHVQSSTTMSQPETSSLYYHSLQEQPTTRPSLPNLITSPTLSSDPMAPETHAVTAVTSAKFREHVRSQRQMEIHTRLETAQREMNNLATRRSLHHSMRSSSSRTGSGARNGVESTTEAEQEMEALREQIRALRTQIDYLQAQQQSDWALGLSDEPPPAYTQNS
ncbi:hypothetical protein AMATHDRAFT_58420 [Amanita thiersii Skay4041]|uniref:Mid2 domain-containing protein n=1 Tax=Amanita thiersii Skay4041 TaxID=703135 RepID=A0A2A9NM97_9AGAR|nr:hypothetical protein AMATHDRAFT_58420 [Amanita thiersii Skay4041]